jgi:predicted MFS family arabinose efflux permease
MVAGTADLFFNAASNSLLPRLLEAARLGAANGQLSAAQTVGEQLLGPLLGGIAFAAQRTVPFLANAASFAISSALVSSLPHVPPAPRSEDTSLRQDVAEAVHFFRTTPLQRRLTAYVALVAFGQGVVYAVEVLYVRDELGLGAGGFGLFLAVSAIGGVLGGLVAGPVTDRVPTSIVIAATGFLSSSAFLFAAMTTVPAVAAGLYVLQTLAVIVGNVTILTARQLITPPHLRGRVANLHRTFVYGGAALSALLAGVVAAGVGVRAAVAVGGGIQFLAALYAVVRIRPAASHLGRLMDLAAGDPAAGGPAATSAVPAAAATPDEVATMAAVAVALPPPAPAAPTAVRPAQGAGVGRSSPAAHARPVGPPAPSAAAPGAGLPLAAAPALDLSAQAAAGPASPAR